MRITDLGEYGRTWSSQVSSNPMTIILLCSPRSRKTKIKGVGSIGTRKRDNIGQLGIGPHGQGPPCTHRLPGKKWISTGEMGEGRALHTEDMSCVKALRQGASLGKNGFLSLTGLYDMSKGGLEPECSSSYSWFLKI